MWVISNVIFRIVVSLGRTGTPPLLFCKVNSQGVEPTC
nr:MAG TPA: hypothetical protein [Caudoviricetes sp.]